MRLFANDAKNGNKCRLVGVKFDTSRNNLALFAAAVAHHALRTAVFATLFSFSHSAFGKAPIKTTVCAIVHSPTKFAGQLVQFGAFYESDGIEHSILLDEVTCKRARHSITKVLISHVLMLALYGSLLNTNPCAWAFE
jgi:hypothetical protein